MNEILFLSLWFGLPGVVGMYLATRRGKNPLLWGVLSAIFPFFLVVLYYQFKPKDRQEMESNPVKRR